MVVRLAQVQRDRIALRYKAEIVLPNLHTAAVHQGGSLGGEVQVGSGGGQNPEILEPLPSGAGARKVIAGLLPEGDGELRAASCRDRYRYRQIQYPVHKQRFVQQVVQPSIHVAVHGGIRQGAVFRQQLRRRLDVQLQGDAGCGLLFRQPGTAQGRQRLAQGGLR